jgi:ZIP family zinc transporter
MNLIELGVLGSLGAGLATGLGAIPAFFLKNVPLKMMDGLLGFSAGIMLGATSFSLVLPAINLGGPWVTSLGMILGSIFLAVANWLIPHLHSMSSRKDVSISFSRVWLFVLAITIHNFPEGMSVGVGFGKGEISEGMALAMGIGFQNMPEGLAVALALIREGHSPLRSFGYATLTGLVEPIGGLIGVSVVTIAHALLPWGLAFAGGAMLFVISSEIIPETHRHGHPMEATFGVIFGFIVMTLFDNLFV